MSSMVMVLDRLLSGAEPNATQEHLMEQAHYAVDNVEMKFLQRFEALVSEISEELGPPEYNASTTGGEERSNPMPKWVTGTNKGDASHKFLRLCYWKREIGISYLLVRMELDTKDRPKYYDLVLGGRRKIRSDSPKMDRLRNQDTSFVGWIKRMITTKKDDSSSANRP
jgi:hypothetical protein